jgi:putative Mg2+ transporter-C (MgtC) family protein
MEWYVELRETLADLNTITMLVRIMLAALAGGCVGFERGYHGRAAGLRTHMLVCLGAALTAMIGCYLTQTGYSSDVQRTGAQVMSGVGFLGAGTILLKKDSSKITGLTTAAGLWSTAAIGLAVGYGLYEAAIVTVIVVVFAFTLMSRLEFAMHKKRQRALVYLELDSIDSIREMMELLRNNFEADEMQVTPARSGHPDHVGMEALIRVHQKSTPEKKIEKLHQLKHVIFALQIQ